MVTTPQDALNRVTRLESFLAQDPDNEALRTDAFDTALTNGLLDKAYSFLPSLPETAPQWLSWQMRLSSLLLAQRDYAGARAVLEPLQQHTESSPEFRTALLHNLAYSEFREGLYEAAIVRLSPCMSGEQIANALFFQNDALQTLWLRCLHHHKQLDTAVNWATQANALGYLSTNAAGVAALAALDNEALPQAIQWSNQSFASLNSIADASLEALVAKATLCLGNRDAEQANLCISLALEKNPQDGRTWSAKGFALLLTQDLEQALKAFEKALANMPEHVGTWHGKGWTQFLMRDLPGAESTFETALALDRNFAENHGALAVIQASIGKTEQAHRSIELASRLDSGNLSGRYAQAILSGQANDTASIQRLARRLLGGRKTTSGEDLASLFGEPPGE
jgi:tetratricopeptide (TPR) repeat protein